MPKITCYIFNINIIQLRCLKILQKLIKNNCIISKHANEVWFSSTKSHPCLISASFRGTRVSGRVEDVHPEQDPETHATCTELKVIRRCSDCDLRGWSNTSQYNNVLRGIYAWQTGNENLIINTMSIEKWLTNEDKKQQLVSTNWGRRWG